MRFGVAVLFIASNGTAARAQAGANWPVYGGDLGASKYSTLSDINRDNVSRLAPLWGGATGDSVKRDKSTRPGNFPAKPLPLNDTPFPTTAYKRGPAPHP